MPNLLAEQQRRVVAQECIRRDLQDGGMLVATTMPRRPIRPSARMLETCQPAMTSSAASAPTWTLRPTSSRIGCDSTGTSRVDELHRARCVVRNLATFPARSSPPPDGNAESAAATAEARSRSPPAASTRGGRAAVSPSANGAGVRPKPVGEEDRQWWLARFTLEELQQMAAMWPNH
jgi:hypothetical protein